jgi:hypothetical protein
MIKFSIARMDEEALTDKQATAKSNAGITMLHCLLRFVIYFTVYCPIGLAAPKLTLP